MLPQRGGDVVDPSGGVRDVIPSKQGYFSNSFKGCFARSFYS